jgi:hypothetical protein
MRKLKVLTVALGTMALTGSALAIPTLTISDGVTSTTATSASGVDSYFTVSFDGAWSVVISTGVSKPAAGFGSAAGPLLDLNIQVSALSSSPEHDLTFTFSDNGFGPSPDGFLAQLSGHVVSGTGQNVTYNTYYDSGNVTAAETSLLTTSGTLAPFSYHSAQSGSAGSLALYSLTEVVTIGGAGTAPGASYSLDASLAGVSSVPDGGTTGMLLGAALSGLAFLRRKMA